MASRDRLRDRVAEVRASFARDIADVLRIEREHGLHSAYALIKDLEVRRAFALEVALQDHMKETPDDDTES